MTLLIILFVLLMLVLLFLLLSKNKPVLFAKNTIVADAIILNIQLTGVCIKNEIQAVIQLQVQPEMGKSFVTDIKEMMSAIDYTKLQPGNKVVVSYNSHNHKDVSILKESLSPVFKNSETLSTSI
jgi:hypothetical protein